MRKFFGLSCKSKNYLYLCTANHSKRVFAEAQMAESVDALVSNTSRFTPVPVRPRLWVRKEEDESLPLFLFTLRRGRSVGGGVAELSLVGDYCYRNLLSLTDDCL